MDGLALLTNGWISGGGGVGAPQYIVADPSLVPDAVSAIELVPAAMGAGELVPSPHSSELVGGPAYEAELVPEATSGEELKPDAHGAPELVPSPHSVKRID